MFRGSLRFLQTQGDALSPQAPRKEGTEATRELGRVTVSNFSWAAAKSSYDWMVLAFQGPANSFCTETITCRCS